MKSFLLRCFYRFCKKLVAADAGIIARKAELFHKIGCSAGSHAEYHVADLHLRTERARRADADQILASVKMNQFIGIDADRRTPHSRSHD